MAVVRGGADVGWPLDERGRIEAREETRRGRLDVALDARHLTGEKQRRPAPDLPRLGQHRRTVHVGVAMHHAEADELGVLQARE